MFCLYPTERTDHTEAYGLKLFESTEWPTLREARIHRNDFLRRHRRRTMLTSATLHKQSILCLLSYDAQRLYALWIPNLNPVGFCVVRAFCGNYKQRRYKYKSLSPINCNLHFCHSIFRMNLFLCLYTSIAEAPTKLKTKQ